MSQAPRLRRVDPRRGCRSRPAPSPAEPDRAGRQATPSSQGSARPERSIMLASAVGPSSQAVWKTKWSLAETAAKPHSLAASTAFPSRSSESRSSPNRISGRWSRGPRSQCSQLPAPLCPGTAPREQIPDGTRSRHACGTPPSPSTRRRDGGRHSRPPSTPTSSASCGRCGCGDAEVGGLLPVPPRALVSPLWQVRGCLARDERMSRDRCGRRPAWTSRDRLGEATWHALSPWRSGSR